MPIYHDRRMKNMKKVDFLPVSKEDMDKRGWKQLDFLYIVGDAYVDHPSFGHAIISRVLESHGYKVGIVALPDWHKIDDFVRMGRPKLGVLVSAGNIDSMVNHYTAAKKRRHDDMYAPGGKGGMRPDRATLVYCNRIKEAFGSDMPILIGGVEASLRRFAHYDYWDDKIRRSILFDSRASILMYGMGEKQIVRIADKLRDGVPVNEITDIPGTCYISSEYDEQNSVLIPSYEECIESKSKYAVSCRLQYYEQNPYIGKTLVQKHGDKYLIQNPPMPPLETDELDEVYALPYMKNYHPMYEKDGGVPAILEVGQSIAHNRGCFGGCNFCAIISHEGRIIQRRSHASLLREAKILTKLKGFKGYIHDVGGPTANFRRTSCDGQLKRGTCRGKPCLSPEPCKMLVADHSDYIKLLRELRSLPGVKKVFVRSGIRFDYLLLAKDDFLYELCKYHVSGQLKIAPEHISDRVTRLMGKSNRAVYLRFVEKFRRMNERLGKKQYLVPYFMSSHPGSELSDAIELAEFIRDMGYHPQQVQDFIPTPGTLSTCMWYTGIDPMTGEKVYSAKSYEDKRMQRALMQYWLPKNHEIVRKALHLGHREDLIGYGPKCLVRPRRQPKQVKKV